MQSRKQAFATLADRLRDALAAGDWETIALLDEECRTLVAALRDEDAFDAGLREQLAELSRLYDDLQQVGCAERERLAGELTPVKQSKQGKRAYKTLSVRVRRGYGDIRGLEIKHASVGSVFRLSLWNHG